MPELPEVEVVKIGLTQNIQNKYINKIICNNTKLRLPIPDNINELLAGKKILNIQRKAKYIVIDLDQQYSIIIHLGMSGRVIYYNYLYQDFTKHDHLICYFTDNSCIVYNDPRRFGIFTILATDSLNDSKLFANLGLEPFSVDFNENYLFNRLRNSSTSIKQAIMDNKLVVGIGNIYAAESLFKAKILPNRPANSLSMAEYKLLILRIKEILYAAIKQGGSSLKDHKTVNGESGYFQNYFYVYGRYKQRCSLCLNIISNIKLGGRSSYFCPTCQV